MTIDWGRVALRITMAAAAAALCMLVPGAAFAQRPNDVLADGPAKEVIVRACTMCHSAAQIVYKPRTPDDWEDLIGKMIDRGAQLTVDEQDAVYAYLVKNFSSKPAAAPQGAAKGSSGR